MNCHFDCVEQKLARLFRRYARLVCKLPLAFVVLPVIVSLFMSFGFIWRFELVKDDLDLYTPIDSRSKWERSELQRIFPPINDSDYFFSLRRFTSNRIGYLIIKMQRTISLVEENIIHKKYFEFAEKLWDRVERMTFKYKDEFYAYRNICVLAPPIPKWELAFLSNEKKEKLGLDEDGRACVRSPLLNLYIVYKSQIFDMLIFKNYPEFYLNDGGFLHVGNLLGAPTNLPPHEFFDINDLYQRIKTPAMLLPYQLKYETPLLDNLADKWERFFDKFLTEFVTNINDITWSLNDVSLHWWTSETLTIETQKDTNKLLKLLVPMFILVTAFTVGCCFVNNCLRSKPWLGLCGVISSGLSVVSSMGILLLGGTKLTSVAYFVPFLAFSIGVDNVFIFIGAWRKTNVFHSVEDRMIATFDDAAVSITVTALTDAVSFAIGCTSTYPSVMNFCLFAFMAICFIYINQLTFFTGCMVISGIRESQFRNSLTLKVMPDVRQRILTESKFFTRSRKRRHDRKDFNDEGISDHAAARFFKGAYSRFLMHGFTKTLVFVLLFLYLAVAGWKVRNIVIGVHPTDLVAPNSSAKITLNVYKEHFFGFGDNLHIWFTNLENYSENVDFWKNDSIREVKKFCITKYSFLADYWWDEKNFFRWYKESAAKNTFRQIFNLTEDGDIYNNNDKFVTLVQAYFKTTPQYHYDVRFVYNNLTFKWQISAVRFLVRLFNVTTSVNQYAATHHFRQLANLSNLTCYVYHPFFEFGDQFDSIVPSLFGNMIFGSIAVVVACLLLIPKPLCALWVCITIISINVGILGYMSLCDVHLDFISMVTIIMSIGASVDFSAHIAYHFAKTDLFLVKDRVRDSLYVVGTPILQSAFSTLLGIMLIAVIDSYTFRAFVKISSLVILFGLFHGLVVLPVLLSVFHWEKELNAASSSSTTTMSGLTVNQTADVLFSDLDDGQTNVDE